MTSLLIVSGTHGIGKRCSRIVRGSGLVSRLAGRDGPMPSRWLPRWRRHPRHRSGPVGAGADRGRADSM
jgi:hypothetical protein